MSKAISVEWSEGTRKVTSCDAAVRLLNELDRKFADRPALVDIVAATGAVLTVGLGAEASVLSFAESPERQPYYASHGNGDADGTIWFDYYGSPTEFPIEQAVPMSDAMRAAEEFCKTGSRPSTVKWESV